MPVTLFAFALCVFAPLREAPTICLDPGHPSEVGKGATGRHYTEIKADWAVAQQLTALLKAKGYRVVLTKSSEGQFVRNRERAEIANRAHADLLLRLHCDSGGQSGFAVFYPTHSATVQGVTGPSEDVLKRTSEIAPAFHKAAAEALTGELPDIGLFPDTKTAVGRKQGALTGSVFSKVPVLLVEMCVMGSRHDEEFIRSKSGQKRMAEALLKGIEAALSAERASSGRN